jgi:hypothetical protein
LGELGDGDDGVHGIHQRVAGFGCGDGWRELFEYGRRERVSDGWDGEYAEVVWGADGYFERAAGFHRESGRLVV